MSLFLLPDVFVFQAKVVVVIRISQPLIDIQIPLTGFYRQKITAFRYWMHDDFL